MVDDGEQAHLRDHSGFEYIRAFFELPVINQTPDRKRPTPVQVIGMDDIHKADRPEPCKCGFPAR